MTESKPQPKRRKTASKSKAAETEEWQKEVEQLSYQEANTALELTLSLIHI